MDTHLLKYHVVDEESGISVAAFINLLIATLWAREYGEKTQRKLKVVTSA